MEYYLNFKKAMKNDYALFIFFIIFLLFFLFTLLIPFIEKDLINIELLIKLGIPDAFCTLDFIFLSIFVFITLLNLILFIFRLVYLQSFCNEQTLVTGTITYSYRAKNGFSLRVEYSYKDKTYVKGFALMKNNITRKILRDKKVSLLIHKQNPKKALIADLYFY